MTEADGSGPAAALNSPPAAEASAFPDLLHRCLEERRADGRSLAILLVDCGVIGRIDAVWGYQVGDAVRERISESLRADVLRPEDFVGEMGRDDLACVLSTVEDPAVPRLAAEKSLRALNAPLWIGEEEIFPHAAIGIAIFPAHGDEAGILLQRARAACTEAGRAPGRIEQHREDRQNPLEAALLHENRLRTAVAEDALDLAFRPRYDLRLGQIMGAEVQLRWNNTAAGDIQAEQAFAAAESAGVVTAMVSSILNRTLRNISEFRYSAGLDLRVGVQLPARALLQADLPDVVQRSLGTWSLRPGRLVLQIGETELLANEPLARESLLALKKIGVRLSIDDPHMAVSSLFLLAGLPFQEIKLDVSAGSEPAAAAKTDRILGALIELAHQLALDVVASGVADDAAADRLKELGCDYMQADYRGPALDPKGFVDRYS